MEPSHVAFGDESYSTAERYRSVAIVTMGADLAGAHTAKLQEILAHSNIDEFKWQKLKNAKYRFGAEKIIDWTIPTALQDGLRVDVLVWDTQDKRHNVRGRDDIANLADMYRFLFKNVLKMRWPNGCTWALYPDENSALDWLALEYKLDMEAWDVTETDLLAVSFPTFRQVFQIAEIRETESCQTPLCQMADFYAGLGVYSRKSYRDYRQWLQYTESQHSLFPQEEASLSNSDKERCRILQYFNTACKRKRMYVSLKETGGLRTFKPEMPLNFWVYEPQHPDDKAPTRN